VALEQSVVLARRKKTGNRRIAVHESRNATAIYGNFRRMTPKNVVGVRKTDLEPLLYDRIEYAARCKHLHLPT
jgi:hypothetical protein